MAELLMGMDVGTTGLKAGLVDAEQGLLAVARETYQVETPGNGRVEIDAEKFWQAAHSAIGQLRRTGDLKDVRAICVSSQANTFVLLDKNDKPLDKAWVWIDGRAEAQARRLTEKFGSQQLWQRCGFTVVNAGQMGAMLRYITENDPKRWESADKLLAANSYVIWRLSGQVMTDDNLAAFTCLYDWSQGKWWDEFVDYVGVPRRLLPKVIPSGKPVGRILPDVAQRLGLSKDVMIVAGSNDQTVGAIGSGNIAPGVLTATTGTALVIYRVNGRTRSSVHRGQEGPFPDGGQSYQLGWTSSGCRVLDWAKQLLWPQSSYDEMFEAIAKIEPGAEGTMMLIDLDGGLGSGAGRDTILKAVAEGICFSLRELIESLGIRLQGATVRAVGGPSRNDIWMQILANVLDARLQRLAHEEAGVVGAAIMGGVGAAVFDSYKQATDRLVCPGVTFEPQPAAAEQYHRLYDQYLKLRKLGDGYYL